MPTIAELRARMPELNGLDDNQAVDAIHQAYYPGANRDDLAKHLGVGAPKVEGTDGDFMRGLKKAGYQIPQTIGGTMGLVGDAVGADGLREYGMGVYKANEDKIAGITKPSDSLSAVLNGEQDTGMVPWLKNAAGYTVGQAATALATGGVGGFIGKQLAMRGIKSGVQTAAEQAIAKDIAARGVKVGAVSALGASNLVQEAGSIYPDAVAQAEKDGRTLDGGDLGRVAGSALAAAAVDTGMDAFIGHKILSGGRKAGESLGRAAAREVPGMMAKEAVTEGIQTGIERFGARQDLTTADAIRDYVDSMGVGAVGGGLGGGVAVLHSQKVAETGPLSRAANIGIDEHILQLTNDPQPLISFPDGSVGHKGDMEAYLTQFADPEERKAKERELMGLDPKTGKRIVPEAPPEPLMAHSQQAEDTVLKAWTDKHDPVSLPYAQALLAAPGAKEHALMIVPHPKGKGYTLVPSKWLTLDTQARAGALQKGDEALLPAPDRAAPGGAIRVDSEGGAAQETYGEQVRTGKAARDERKIAEMEAQRIRDLGESVPHGPKRTAPKPPIPTLNDVLAPGDGIPKLSDVLAPADGIPVLNQKPDIPTLTDVLKPGNPKEKPHDAPAPAQVDDGTGSGGTAVRTGPADGAGPEGTGRVHGRGGSTATASGGKADPDPVRTGAAADAKPALSEESADPDPYARNIFHSPQVAEAFIKRRGIDPAKFEVVSTGEARWGVKPKAPATVDDLAGKPIDKEWTAFAKDSGTLNIDRADMPQVKAEHRGALVNFLNARGIAHQQEEMPAGDLKPTQRQFSPARVDQAKGYEGGDRSILVSSDNHILDGHHQWLAKLDDNAPVKVIRLDAPINDLLAQVKEFPSAQTAEGASNAQENHVPAVNGPAADKVPDGSDGKGRDHGGTPAGTAPDAHPAPGGSVPASDVQATPAVKPKADWQVKEDRKAAKLAEQLATANANAADRAAKKDANENAVPAGNDTAVLPSDTEIDTGKGIPLAFFNKVKVQHEVWIEDEQTFGTDEVSAAVALKSVREDKKNLQALLKCLKG